MLEGQLKMLVILRAVHIHGIRKIRLFLGGSSIQIKLMPEKNRDNSRCGTRQIDIQLLLNKSCKEKGGRELLHLECKLGSSSF